MRRLARMLGAIVLVVAILCALPIAGVELTCRVPATDTPAFTPLVDAADRRSEGDSFLSYPEWYIVHAYADLAGVTRQGSESDFNYAMAVRGFWTSLCGATRQASMIGGATFDQRVTDYIIGLSFTAEMAIKGAWERTIGTVTAWLRGPQRTAEDDYALSVADRYAAFLQQTPWYRFPFAATLRDFWTSVPAAGPHMPRKVERRIALTLEWGGKALYAQAMAALAGASPADLRIRSVVRGLTGDDLAAMPQITTIRTLDDDLTLVETPRYEAFTGILRALAARGRSVVEIAGNRRVLTTVIARRDGPLDTGGATVLFSLPIQSRPDWRRVGLASDVGHLTAQIGSMERQGATFEHAYDY